MKRVTPELLDQCLADLKAGRTTLEACLAAHPEAADELSALLLAALAIGPAPAVTPDPVFQARTRATLLSLERAPARAGWLGSWWPLPRLAVPALLLLLLLIAGLGGGGVVYAAHDSLPGDLLHPVRQGVESLQVALATSDAARAAVHLQQAEARLADIAQAQGQGRGSVVAELARQYGASLSSAQAHLAATASAGEDVAALQASFQAQLPQFRAALQQAQGRASPEAAGALQQALGATPPGLQRSQDARGNGDAVPQAGPTTEALVTTCTTVLSSVEQLSTMLAGIASATEDPQEYEGLQAKLATAQESLGRCDLGAAQGQILAFMNSLNALLRSCRIAFDDYIIVYEATSTAMGALGGDSPEMLTEPECSEVEGDASGQSTPPKPKGTPPGLDRRQGEGGAGGAP